MTCCVAESVQRGGEEGRRLQSVRSDASNHRDRLRQRADQDAERRESDTDLMLDNRFMASYCVCQSKETHRRDSLR